MLFPLLRHDSRERESHGCDVCRRSRNERCNSGHASRRAVVRHFPDCDRAGWKKGVQEKDYGLLLHKRILGEILYFGTKTMPESISGKLAQIVLPESQGAAVRLGSLWENNLAVIVFLRHYG